MSSLLILTFASHLGQHLLIDFAPHHRPRFPVSLHARSFLIGSQIWRTWTCSVLHILYSCTSSLALGCSCFDSFGSGFGNLWDRTRGVPTPEPIIVPEARSSRVPFPGLHKWWVFLSGSGNSTIPSPVWAPSTFPSCPFEWFFAALGSFLTCAKQCFSEY